MKPFKTLLPLAVACAFLAGAHAASNNDGEGGSPTVIEHGAKAAANGVERGAKAAGHGIGLSNTRLRLRPLQPQAAPCRVPWPWPEGLACALVRKG